MRLADLNKRISAIEDALSVPGDCHVCHGMGNFGPFAVGSIESIDIAPACPACGRIAHRQHFVEGVTQSELAAMFRPSPTKNATLHYWRDV